MASATAKDEDASTPSSHIKRKPILVYSVADGSSGTITRTCSLSAQASGSMPQASQISVFVSVGGGFTVQLLPVTIQLAGVTDDSGTLKILTGQEIRASVVINSTTSSPDFSIKPDSHRWTVTGGKPFRDYDQSIGYLSKVDAENNMERATMRFFTAERETVLVKCDAELQFPAGATLLGGLPQVSITAKLLQSLKPDCIWRITSGEVRLLNTDFGYIGKPGINSDGQNWIANITVPAPFAGGGGCFAQLITADRTLSGNEPSGATVVYEKFPYNALECLDVGFPYSPPNYYGSFVLHQWNVATQRGESGNSPLQPLTWNVSGVDWYQSKAQDSFKSWVMFRPREVPRFATEWVPLRMYTWSWGGTAENTQQGWQLTNSSNPSPGNTAETADHPQWTLVSPSPFQFRRR